MWRCRILSVTKFCLTAGNPASARLSSKRARRAGESLRRWRRQGRAGQASRRGPMLPSARVILPRSEHDHSPEREYSLSPPASSRIVNRRHIRDRRPLTESFVLPPTKGVHPMPHKIERKFAFGPSALNDLAQAFDTAWLELRAWGIEANTDEQVKCVKTNLARR